MLHLGEIISKQNQIKNLGALFKVVNKVKRMVATRNAQLPKHLVVAEMKMLALMNAVTTILFFSWFWNKIFP